MSRKVIPSLVAAALALTSLSAAPAAADHRHNLNRFIAGAGTILLLNEFSRGGSANVYRDNRDTDRGYTNRGYSHRGDKDRGFKRGRAPLPGYCLRRIRTHQGPVRMFGNRCLQRNYSRADWLPRACRMQVRVWRNGHKVTRVGYHPRCLRNRGYRVAGRR